MQLLLQVAIMTTHPRHQ